MFKIISGGRKDIIAANDASAAERGIHSVEWLVPHTSCPAPVCLIASELPRRVVDFTVGNNLPYYLSAYTHFFQRQTSPNMDGRVNGIVDENKM